MLDIAKEIVEKAKDCPNNYACLHGEEPHCQIKQTVGTSVFFTCQNESLNCPYQYSYANLFMCTCPVRQEIYRKYKK